MKRIVLLLPLFVFGCTRPVLLNGQGDNALGQTGDCCSIDSDCQTGLSCGVGATAQGVCTSSSGVVAASGDTTDPTSDLGVTAVVSPVDANCDTTEQLTGASCVFSVNCNSAEKISCTGGVCDCLYNGQVIATFPQASSCTDTSLTANNISWCFSAYSQTTSDPPAVVAVAASMTIVPCQAGSNGLNGCCNEESATSCAAGLFCVQPTVGGLGICTACGGSLDPCPGAGVLGNTTQICTMRGTSGGDTTTGGFAVDIAWSSPADADPSVVWAEPVDLAVQHSYDSGDPVVSVVDIAVWTPVDFGVSAAGCGGAVSCNGHSYAANCDGTTCSCEVDGTVNLIFTYAVSCGAPNFDAAAVNQGCHFPTSCP